MSCLQLGQNVINHHRMVLGTKLAFSTLINVECMMMNWSSGLSQQVVRQRLTISTHSSEKLRKDGSDRKEGSVRKDGIE